MTSEDLLLDAINSVELNGGMGLDEVVVSGSGNLLKLQLVQQAVATAFVRAVRSAMAGEVVESRSSTGRVKYPVSKPTQAPRSSEDVKRTFRDLAELHQEGLLAYEEYEAKKWAGLAEM